MASSLVLEDFLFPGEIVIFQSGRVKTLNDRFDFYVTDQRILLYRRRGVVFKKDRVVAERIENIQTLHYDEKGIAKKKGVLHIETISKKMEPLEGTVSDIKAIWQELQKHIKKEG
ncbi:MAG: hypothetical protein JSV75_06655 [Candidatus Bathyarchaeota archaeon]|nr:MAG: hypothetical protein JSV75_06655 [Candidatus Bathyarchaeota archaeon]